MGRFFRQRGPAAARHQRLNGDLPRDQASLSNKVVIFQHIAKTAGSTLNVVFSRIYSPELRINALSRTRISPLGMTQNDEVIRAINEHLDQEQPLKYLGGHVGFGVHRAFRPGTAAYVTVMRDPVERAISNFSYVAKLGLVDGIDPGMSINSYMRHRGDQHLWFSDTQLRAISDDPQVHPQDLPLTATTADVRKLTLADIKAAARNIVEFYDIVGVSDRLDEFLVLFAGRSGALLSDLVYHDENVNAERPPLSTLPSDLLAKVRSANRRDLILFRWVDRRFRHSVTAAGPSFQTDLIRFRLLNAAYRGGTPQTELDPIPASWPTSVPP